MFRFSFLIYLLLVEVLQAAAQFQLPDSLSTPAASPKREVRAVWLTTIGGLDWPHSYAQSKASIAKQQGELCRLLDQYAKAGINTVLIQTRVRGTVIYPSTYEPWDGCLSGFLERALATTRCGSPSTSATSGAWSCTPGW